MSTLDNELAEKYLRFAVKQTNAGLNGKISTEFAIGDFPVLK